MYEKQQVSKLKQNTFTKENQGQMSLTQKEENEILCNRHTKNIFVA